MKKILLGFMCLVFTVFTLTACSRHQLKTNAIELSKSFSRNTTETVELNEQFKTTMTEFSMKLFKGIMTKDTENDLVSFLSAAICLAMIANGADGTTKLQMEQALGMDIEMLNKCLYAYTSSLYNSDDCKLNLANSIWFRNEENRLHVNDEFLQINANWYNAQVYAAPFDDSTTKDINNWCKYYTDGMIEKMIDTINADAVMYLINALSFDAKWANKYEENDVFDGVFTNYDGKKKNVKMLSSKESVYFSSDKVEGFAKNYSGDKYSFMALLPNKGIDIYDYINSLDGNEWLNLWNTRKSTPLSAIMPEFTYSSSMKLNDVLKSMGMTDMFEDYADFSKLGYSEISNLCISDVSQKTFIQVDRNGTKAAAITWGTAPDSAIEEKIRIVLNRPFIYSIVDNATGLPIFIGAVTNL